MSHFYPDRSAMPRISPPTDAARRQQVRPAREIPRYRVVLLHDALHDLMFVVRCVMELMRFPRAEATHKMWEAHHRGRSVLLTTYRERAEWFVECFAARGLKVTIEPHA